MVTNLLALCKHGPQIIVKHVRVSQEVQTKIEGLFQAQAAVFLDGVTEEIEFGGDWKPDEGEILVIDAPVEAAAINAALDGNLMALPTLDAANFSAEGIKALVVAVDNGGSRRILVQAFTAQQILARRFSLLLDGDTFKQLTAPAFTLDNYISGIIEDGKLKFKSYIKIKRIFDLALLYEAASDQEIDQFCLHDSLAVADVAIFKQQADQTIRKLTNTILHSGVLNQYQVVEITEKANGLGLNVDIQDGKIVMPADRKSIKQLLRFLDDGIYEASLTSKKYITNSKRLL